MTSDRVSFPSQLKELIKTFFDRITPHEEDFDALMAELRKPPSRTPDRLAALVSPALVYGMFAYSGFVVISPLILNYLISPAEHGYRSAPQVETAIGIAVALGILWILSFIAYTRLLVHTLLKKDKIPPNVTQSPPSDKGLSSDRLKRFFTCRSKKKEDKDLEMGTDIGQDSTPNVYVRADLSQRVSAMPDMSDFYMQDIYVCDPDGLPKYCNKCGNYKSARGHHDGRSDTCVHKLDHFCPWISGPVAESNYKFFVQFLVYLTVYTCFLVVLSIYFVVTQANHRVMLDPSKLPIDPNILALFPLSFFFFLFSSTMMGFHLHVVRINVTTIEDKNKHKTVWWLAVRLTGLPPANSKLPFRVMSFPLVQDPANIIEERHFAVLKSKSGENPFDLGWLRNVRSIMGNHVLEWLFPITRSPVTIWRQKTGMDHQYGKVVEKMIKRTGLPGMFVATEQRAG